MKFQLIALLFSCFLLSGFATENSGCASTQYLELASTGIIQCSFQDGYFGVIWYDSLDVLHDEAILVVENSVKSGRGFLSGEFDIFPNGSLIVTNVSIKHEGNYTVIMLETPTTKTSPYVINVFIIAETFSSVPEISNCDNENKVCFQTVAQFSEISCTVRDARPTIPLTWMIRTIDGDRNISSHLTIQNGTRLPFATSIVSISNPFIFSSLLTLLVCKAHGPPGLLDRYESLVLIQNGDKAPSSEDGDSVYLQVGSILELACADIPRSFLVWQLMQPTENAFRNVLFATLVGENFTHQDGVEGRLNYAGSLIIDDVRIQHEGVYRCISGNGFEDAVKTYNATMFVTPNPPYPVVDGCSDQQYCILEDYLTGSLTCTLSNVRPQVKLYFIEQAEGSSESIAFYDTTLTVVERVDTFDIILRSRYRWKSASISRRTIECRAMGTSIEQLRLSTKFDLWLVQGSVPVTTDSVEFSRRNVLFIVIVIVAVFSSLLLVFIGIIIVRRRILRGYSCYSSNSKSRSVTRKKFSLVSESSSTGKSGARVQKQLLNDTGELSEEDIPMMQQNADIEKKDYFISELKSTYLAIYNAIQPVPYIRDKLYSVNQVFVESGIEYLVPDQNPGEQGSWVKLPSHHNILDNFRVKATRRILEGEPGYGKSLLTLQLAYDWCNKIPASNLKNTDIFILLRLRQLRRVETIYSAIKQFLLPQESKLTESDIEKVLCESSSVVIVLDGYDEYPDTGNETNPYIHKIIASTMFANFDVILTTRSSCLPKTYPALTERLRLKGFDDNARDEYIGKNISNNDIVVTQKIKERLEHNPFFEDLCQVPLFFVMVAHMSHDIEQFQKLCSLTSFFGLLVSCFHSHMTHKAKDGNSEYPTPVKDHLELDKVAYEGLNSKDKQTIWNSEDLRKILGRGVYEQYVRTGILVEQEVRYISSDPLESDRIQYRTEVRFFHKLFCEWYAAHYLSGYLSRNNVTLASKENLIDGKDIVHHDEDAAIQLENCLKYLDPVELQYLYLFVCGLNPIAATRIIGYLKAVKGTHNIAIQCILEYSGDLEDVLPHVQELCTSQIDIKGYDSLLLQRSSVHLLEIASKNKISCSGVSLYDSYNTVNPCDGKSILLKSGISLPVLATIKELAIVESGKKITTKELTGILEYASMCQKLETVRFHFCDLPELIQPNIGSVLRKRSIKVLWGRHSYCDDYVLNLQSCTWEAIKARGRRL